MLRTLLPPLLLLACVGAPPSAREQPGVRELWVSASAPAGGDGARERPLRRLEEALDQAAAQEAPLQVHLAPGHYAAGRALPADVQLLGEAAGVVLGGDLEAPEGARLVGLAVEGGAWGLRGAGPLALEDVALRGQREGGVRLTGGHLQARRVRLEAAAGSAVGLALGGAARAEVWGLQLAGPYGRGLEVTGDARLELESLRAAGPGTVLHQRGGHVRLRRAALAGGAGPGIFVAGGSLALEDVVVVGHEYGLQAGGGAVLQVRGFASVGAQRAGVGLVASRARLQDLQVLGAGPFGGLQLINADVQLRHFGIQDARAYGLSALEGRLEARGGRIVRTRGEGPDEGSSDGDALHLRKVEARVEGVQVRGAAGLGLLVAQGARVSARDLVLEGCAAGGVLVDTRGVLQLRGLRVSGGAPPALGLLDEAQGSAEVVDAEGTALWADCASGAQLRLGYAVPEGLRGPCVHR